MLESTLIQLEWSALIQLEWSALIQLESLKPWNSKLCSIVFIHLNLIVIESKQKDVLLSQSS